MVGLEVCRLVGDDTVSRGMRFVEPVAGELGHQFEDVVCLVRRHPLCHGARDEPLLLLIHLRFDLLAHGPPQQVRLAEGISGEHLGDLHHLLLVDHDAVGLFQYGLDEGMQAVGKLLAPLAGDETGNVVHRSRTVERHDGDDVLDAVGVHLAKHVAHSRAFQLEHADRIALAQHLVGRLVVERHPLDVEFGVALANEGLRLSDDGQGLEAEEVELDEPRLLDPLHAELRCRQVRARIAIERHELFERPIADDDAGRMGRCMAVEPLELHADLEHRPHERILLPFFLQPGFPVHRLLEGDGTSGIVGDELAQPVDLAVGHLQDPPHVAAHGAGLQLAECDDLGHPVGTELVLNVGDHLVASVLAEVDVEVRHRHALWIEEPLEQQVEPQRIEIRDGQRVGDERPGAGPAARTDRDPFRLGELDEVGDDQEVAREIHVDDDVELEFEPLLVVLWAVSVDWAVGREAHCETVAGLDSQLLGLVALGREPRQDRLCRQRTERAAPGDLDGIGRRFRQVGEQSHHVPAALEAMLGRQPVPVVVADDLALGDADQRVMRSEVIRGGEVGFVRCDQRYIAIIGELDQAGLGPLLRLRVVALQLDVEAVAEDVLEQAASLFGERALAMNQSLVDGPVGPSGQANESLAETAQHVQ